MRRLTPPFAALAASVLIACATQPAAPPNSDNGIFVDAC